MSLQKVKNREGMYFRKQSKKGFYWQAEESTGNGITSFEGFDDMSLLQVLNTLGEKGWKLAGLYEEETYYLVKEEKVSCE